MTVYVLVVALVSATGGSAETLERAGRFSVGTATVALTNNPDSELAARCDHVVEMLAAPEVGGVACRTYRHTLALLLALGRSRWDVALRCREAASLTEGLLSDRSWLDACDEVLGGGPAGIAAEIALGRRQRRPT